MDDGCAYIPNVFYLRGGGTAMFLPLLEVTTFKMATPSWKRCIGGALFEAASSQSSRRSPRLSRRSFRQAHLSQAVKIKTSAIEFGQLLGRCLIAIRAGSPR